MTLERRLAKLEAGRETLVMVFCDGHPLDAMPVYTCARLAGGPLQLDRRPDESPRAFLDRVRGVVGRKACLVHMDPVDVWL